MELKVKVKDQELAEQLVQQMPFDAQFESFIWDMLYFGPDSFRKVIYTVVAKLDEEE